MAKCTHFLATFVTLRTHPEEEEKVAVVVTFFRECDNQLRKSFSAFLIFHRLISRAQNTAIRPMCLGKEKIRRGGPTKDFTAVLPNLVRDEKRQNQGPLT